MTEHIPPDFNMWDWLGAWVGTVISLFYDKPATRSDFLTRCVVSVLSGGTFGFVVLLIIGWPITARNSFAAGAAMAFFSYAMIGLGYRLIKSIKLPR